MLDLERFCKKHRVPFIDSGHHHCHEGWLQIHCPFCAGGREGWHLGFNLKHGSFNCWRCGTLKVWDVVATLLNTARKDLIYKAIQAHQKEGTPRPPRETTGRSRKLTPPPGTGPLQRAHKKYLRGRDFSPRGLKKLWSLQATGHLSGIWGWRIMAPIFDSRGAVASYIGRSISDKVRPKYKFTSNKESLENPANLLYGSQAVPGDAVVIVEGPTDVWRLGPGAVAVMGIDFTISQVNLLRAYTKRYVLFDPEPLAQSKAESLATWLSYYPGTTEILDAGQTDPGAYSRRKAKKVMRSLGFRLQ